jgi:hypothetical protein
MIESLGLAGVLDLWGVGKASGFWGRFERV